MEKIKIRPGYIVINTSTARGGVKYVRTAKDERITGDTLTATHTTVKTVDHVDVVKAIDALVKKADSTCRRFCARGGWGWYCTPEALPDLRRVIEGLREECDAMNLIAQRSGSDRRAHLGILVAQLDLVSGDTAREVARTVTDTLTALRDALFAGDLAALVGPIGRARNLDQLAVGLPGTAVKMALESVRAWRVEIRESIACGNSAEGAGAALNLTALDTAISWYSDEGETFDAAALVDAAA